MKTWTPEQVNYLRDNFSILTHSQIAEKLGKTVSAVKGKVKVMGFTISKAEKWQRLSDASYAKNNLKTLTVEQNAVVKEYYLIVPIKELARQFGRSPTAVKTSMRRQGLKLPLDIAQSRRNFQLRKAAPNKGKKWADMFSEEQIEVLKKRTFKKGNKPHNTLSDGIITTRLDKRKVLQKYIRIEENRWLSLSVFNWEQVHGKVEKGACIIFKNGDTMNCDIENLECISREELMKRNSIARFSPDLRSAISILSKLKKQLIKNEE